MKIFPISDIHNEFKNRNDIFYDIPKECDIIVIAGDLNVGASNVIRDLKAIKEITNKKIVYVPGNHEFYHSTFHFENGRLWNNSFELEKIGIHILHNKSVVIDGVNFIGAIGWPDGSYVPITPELFKNYTNDFIYIYDFMELVNIQKEIEGINYIINNLSYKIPNVVITHFIPTIDCIGSEWIGHIGSPCFTNSWANIISSRKNKKRKRIKFWIHGHSHDIFNSKIDGTVYVRNPVGYPHEYKKFDKWNVLEL